MEMTPKERYLGVKAELQDLAHRLADFRDTRSCRH